MEHNGTSIIDVTNPKKPQLLKHLPGEEGKAEQGGAQMVRICSGATLPKADKIKFYMLSVFGNQAHEMWDVTQPENLARVDDRFTFVFNPSLGSFLGLGAQGNSVTVNLNALKGGTLNFTNNIDFTTGTVTTFSQYVGLSNPDAPITPFNLINHAEFWLTNTTPIPIYSLSVLNYSGNTLTVTLDPTSNPSTPLQPGSSVSVGITDPSDPDNTGSYSATPFLFYDAGVGGWQNNFQSPDFPVLGGFLSARGIDISTQNSYGNGERFSSFSSDNDIDFGEDFQGTTAPDAPGESGLFEAQPAFGNGDQTPRPGRGHTGGEFPV
jgi:hypothetical protein